MQHPCLTMTVLSLFGPSALRAAFDNQVLLIKRFDNQVLLIKTAWGGKSLYKDFRPPSSGGAVGPYYTKMLAEVRAALENLEQDFPGSDRKGSELAGFVWYQGWNDGYIWNASSFPWSPRIFC
jgi:hypothetical protein